MKKAKLLLNVLFLLSLATFAQAQKTYWMVTPDGFNVAVPDDVVAVILHKTKAPEGGAGSVPKYRTFTKDGSTFHENEIAWETPKLSGGNLTWVTDEGVGIEWKECNTQNPLWNSFVRALKKIAKPYDEKGEWSQAKIVIFEGANKPVQTNTVVNTEQKAAQPVAPKTAPNQPAAANSGSTNCPNSVLTNAEIAEILRVHNETRAAVGTPPLKWNCALAKYAQEWANKDVFEHRSGDDLQKIIPGIWAGENLSTDANSNTPMAQMIQGWIDEKPNWNNGTKTCAPGTVCGHYTQMVWRATTEIGCGINRKSSTMGDEWKGQATYLVCNYSPGGNDGGAAW